MKTEPLIGKKLIRIFEWFCWRNSSILFEFEGGVAFSTWEGQDVVFETRNDLVLFLDKEKLSHVWYTDSYYRKRTALEEYSREVLGSVEDIYIKHCDIVSVNCNHCIWAKYHYKEEKYCMNCWCYGWGEGSPLTGT